jgi:hypothetical protein
MSFQSRFKEKLEDLTGTSNSHKRPEQRFHWKEFTEEYLLKLEPYCHQCLQLSKDELNMWIHDKDIDFDPQHYVCGYHYENKKRRNMLNSTLT